MMPTDMNNLRFKVLMVLSLIFLKHSTNAQQHNWAKRIGNVGFDDSYA
jgi:hypothetical protein